MQWPKSSALKSVRLETMARIVHGTKAIMETAIDQFENRNHAGELLAEKLQNLTEDHPVILALPRGGIPTAAPIARALGQKLDLLLVKKISAPGHPEVAIGAIAEDGDPVWQKSKIHYLDIEKSDLDRAVVKARQALQRQRGLWKMDSRIRDIKDKTVILVDDGLATGSTMGAAIDFLQKRSPKKLIIAVPVGSDMAVKKMQALVDEVVCLKVPLRFHSVSDHYRQFNDVSEREVLEILEQQSPLEKAKENPMIEDILKNAVPLKRTSSLDRLLRTMSESRIVMLGEATHGTKEFYQLRRTISQKLIEDYGFSFIAVEGDWPDCWNLNQYIRNGRGKSAKEVMQNFNRWPTWMWANNEVEKLIEWIKANKGSFYGLDVYSLYESVEVVKKFAQSLDPEIGDSILHSYECFDRFENNEKSYTKHLVHYPSGCQDEVLASLRKLLRLRLEEAEVDLPELFNAQQNARIIKNAETYYRAVVGGDEDSWNVRDEHMMETLDMLLRQHGEDSKAIVWAHNTHIGDYHATDMLRAGYINLGGLARERHGMDNVFLCGFGTYEGEVTAGHAWGSPAEKMKVPPAKPGSIEHDFHQVAQHLQTPQFWMVFDHEKQSPLTKVQPHRAIGVVYQTEYERAGHNYVPTSMANRYDGFIFVDHTEALMPLAASSDRRQMPETWPTGI